METFIRVRMDQRKQGHAEREGSLLCVVLSLSHHGVPGSAWGTGDAVVKMETRGPALIRQAKGTKNK